MNPIYIIGLIIWLNLNCYAIALCLGMIGELYETP